MLSEIRAFTRRKAHEALLGPTSPPQGTSSSVDGMRAALESVVAETQAWSTAVALITSAINGLSAPVVCDLSHELTELVPSPTPISRAVVAGLMDVPLTDETAASIAALFARIAASAPTLQSFCADVAILGHPSAALLHGAKLQAQWSGVARMTAETLGDIDREVRQQLDSRYSQSNTLLISLLRSAAGGGVPCLDDHGMPLQPNLPQRRRTPRIGLLQSCKIESATRTYDAFARDISRGGLGLQNLQQITVGEYVRVTLQHGRAFEGRIAWSDAKSAGLTFAKPLAANDPLLAI